MFKNKISLVLIIGALFILSACSVSERIDDPTAEDPAVEVENLLVNPGFEDRDGNQAVGWTASGSWGNKFTVTAEAARTGNYGLKIDSDVGEHLYAAQHVDIEGGKTYEISAWVRSDKPLTNDGAIKYELYQSTGQYISEVTEVFTSTTVWTQMKVRFEAPVDAGRARIFVRRRFNPGHIYYDDVSVTEVK